MRLAELLARALEGERVQGVLHRQPLLLPSFGRRVLASRAEEKILDADQLAARFEFERRADGAIHLAFHTGLLPRLANRRVGGALAWLDVSLRKNPDRRIFLRANEQHRQTVV